MRRPLRLRNGGLLQTTVWPLVVIAIVGNNPVVARYILERKWIDAAGAHGRLVLRGRRQQDTDDDPNGTESVPNVEPVEPTAEIAVLRYDISMETDSRLKLFVDAPTSPRATVLPEAVKRRRGSGGTCLAAGTGMGCHLGFFVDKDPATFQVKRVGERNGVLFDTSVAKFVYKDQLIYFSTSIPRGAKLFGLPESTRDTLAIQTGQTRLIWPRDTAAKVFNEPTYGAHPFLIAINPDGTAYGLLVLTSNAIEVTLADETTVSFRILGGALELYIFAGPQVKDVVQQYTALVGFPAMMPQWALGFHNCRWGYKNVGELEEVTKKYEQADIPITSFCADIDYMRGYRDFTLDPDNFPEDRFKSYLESLHANGQRMVLVVNPGIKVDSNYTAYRSGIETDIFIKGGFGNKPYTGMVWPGAVHFPDFYHPQAERWWTEQIREFLEMAPVDGLFVDMNEVANMCNTYGFGQECHIANDTELPNCPRAVVPPDYPGKEPTREDMTDIQCCDQYAQDQEDIVVEKQVVICQLVNEHDRYDFPPYSLRNGDAPATPQTITLGARSLPLSTVHYGGVREYDVKPTYGSLVSKATVNALKMIRPAQRPFVLSRATFVGHGSYAAHSLGESAARWEDLRASIVGMLTFSLVGVPMVGAEICGFLEDTTSALCSRWIQVGAFSPFSRVHNHLNAIPQELYRWEETAESARKALRLRYRLMPYYYTLFYEAQLRGSMVMQPFFAAFPGDQGAFAAMERQYMVGDALLFTPILELDALEVTGYFPKGYWYSLVEGQADVNASAGGMSVTLPTPLTATNVHVREGYVVPARCPDTALSDLCLELIVALDSEGQAKGSVYLDDGEQPRVGSDALVLGFSVKDCELTVDVRRRSRRFQASWPVPQIRRVTIFGANEENGTIAVQGAVVRDAKVSSIGESRSLLLTGLEIPTDRGARLTWTPAEVIGPVKVDVGPSTPGSSGPRLLWIVLGLVVGGAVVAGGAYFYFQKASHGRLGDTEDEDDEAE